jgi:hypothetical protein
MNRATISGFLALGLCLGASSAFAAPNCAQVNKYLQTGRTPQDVAETMVIGVDEVKKCQAEAGKAGAAPAAPAAGAPAAPAGETKEAPKK